MIFKLELKDDMVMIHSLSGQTWTLYGSVMLEALWEARHFKWYKELTETNYTVVNALFTLCDTLQLPPDNLI